MTSMSTASDRSSASARLELAERNFIDGALSRRGIMVPVRCAVVVVAMAGCAASPATRDAPKHAHVEQRVEPPPTGTPTLLRPVIAARPPLAAYTALLPDPEHDLRWPLSVSAHPELEPSFAIAPALAQPGLEWLELCRMGVMNRYGSGRLRDYTIYLRAWCTVADGNLDRGLSMLLGLQSSVTPQLAPAVRMDIVSILAAGTADDAERLIAKHQLGGIERLDLLAGTFVELGKREDAYAINQRALQADRTAVQASSCRRLTRAIVLGPADVRDRPLEELRQLAEQDKPDPSCVELHRELACWVFMTRASMTSVTGPIAHCGQYWLEAGISPEERAVVEAYVGWPRGRAFADEWLRIAQQAAKGLPIAGADGLAITALEAVLRADRCWGPHVSEARTLAQRILYEPARKRTVEDSRIRRLIDQPAQLCAN